MSENKPMTIQYYKCDHCEGDTSLIDPNINYSDFGDIKVICKECSLTHEIWLIEKNENI